MFTSNAPRNWRSGNRTRPAYTSSQSASLRDDLDAEELLAHEHVIAVLELGVALDAEEGAVLGAEIGEEDALAAEGDLRVAAADERVVLEVHVVPVAAERHHLADGAHAQADVAAAEELHEPHPRRPPRRGEDVGALLVGAEAGRLRRRRLDADDLLADEEGVAAAKRRRVADAHADAVRRHLVAAVALAVLVIEVRM